MAVEQVKIQRIFQLKSLLAEKPRTVNYLSVKLEKTKSQIYKDIGLLKSLGFAISKNRKNEHFLESYKATHNIYFETKEIEYLLQVINLLDTREPMPQALIKKLSVSGVGFTPLDNQNAQMFIKFTTVEFAIKEQKWIKLINYDSNSSSKRDRVVFPIAIEQHSQIVCFDYEAKAVKNFKFERCQAIEELERQKPAPTEITTAGLDLFGIAGTTSQSIALQMTNRAKNIFCEEHPKYGNLIVETKNNKKMPYELNIDVYGFEGVGRFVLGLITEIKIIDNVDFKKYIKNKIKDAQILDS